jgi:hypothetical protein
MKTLTFILISAVSLVTLTASFLFIKGLFPARVGKVRENLESNWKRSFWIGLANTMLITILVVGLGSLGANYPVFYLPAFAIYGAFLIGLLYGLTAFIQILGERLFADFPPVKRDLRAAAVFVLASLLPFVGWFLLLPYCISLGVGAVAITLFQKKAPAENAEKKAQ